MVLMVKKGAFGKVFANTKLSSIYVFKQEKKALFLNDMKILFLKKEKLFKI